MTNKEKEFQDPDRAIIRSIIDQDFYTYTQGQMIFNQFPEAKVTYRFTNRGGTRFPPGFDEKLQDQINLMANLRMTNGEYEFLKGIRFFKPTYLEWLKNYQFNPDAVKIGYPLNAGGMVPIGDLEITINEPWFRGVYWEVPILAIVSELLTISQGTPLPQIGKNVFPIKLIRCKTLGLTGLTLGPVVELVLSRRMQWLTL